MSYSTYTHYWERRKSWRREKQIKFLLSVFICTSFDAPYVALCTLYPLLIMLALWISIHFSIYTGNLSGQNLTPTLHRRSNSSKWETTVFSISSSSQQLELSLVRMNYLSSLFSYLNISTPLWGLSLDGRNCWCQLGLRLAEFRHWWNVFWWDEVVPCIDHL
jgi:hypothetical protein